VIGAILGENHPEQFLDLTGADANGEVGDCQATSGELI
jgi:hypothetical protein